MGPESHCAAQFAGAAAHGRRHRRCAGAAARCRRWTGALTAGGLGAPGRRGLTLAERGVKAADVWRTRARRLGGERQRACRDAPVMTLPPPLLPAQCQPGSASHSCVRRSNTCKRRLTQPMRKEIKSGDLHNGIGVRRPRAASMLSRPPRRCASRVMPARPPCDPAADRSCCRVSHCACSCVARPAKRDSRGKTLQMMPCCMCSGRFSQAAARP